MSWGRLQPRMRARGVDAVKRDVIAHVRFRFGSPLMCLAARAPP